MSKNTDAVAQSPVIASNASLPTVFEQQSRMSSEQQPASAKMLNDYQPNFVGSIMHADIIVKIEDDSDFNDQAAIGIGSSLQQQLNSPPQVSPRHSSLIPMKKNPADIILSSANNIIVTGSAIPLKPLQHLKQRRAFSRSPAYRQTSSVQMDGGNSSHDSDLLDGGGSGQRNGNYRRATIGQGAVEMSPAPIEAVLLHSPTPSPPSSDSHNFRPLSAAGSEISPAKRKRRTKDEGIKGLRYFALQVCEKVRTKRQTNYNSVAEELVQEHTRPPYFQPSLYTADQIAGEQKNIRRRVYDALNVLMALNIIQRDGRDIRWNGFPRVLSEAGLSAEDTRVNRRRRLIQTEQDTMELLLGTIGTMHVIDENRSRQNKVPSIDLINALNIGVDADRLKTFIAENCMEQSSQTSNFDKKDMQQSSQESLGSMSFDHAADPCPQYRHPSDLLLKAEAACNVKAGKPPPVSTSSSSSAVSMDTAQPSLQQQQRVTQREPDDELAHSSSSALNSAVDLFASYHRNNNSLEQLNADRLQRNIKKGLHANNRMRSPSYAALPAAGNPLPASGPISSSATSTSSLLSASTSSVATSGASASSSSATSTDAAHADYVMHEPTTASSSLPVHATDETDAQHGNLMADFAAELSSLGPHTSFGSIEGLSDTDIIDDTISVSQLYAMQTDMQEPPRPPSYYAYEADHNPYGGGTNNFDYYQQRYGHFYHRQDRQTTARTTAVSEAHEMDFSDIATLPIPHADAGINRQQQQSTLSSGSQMNNNSLYYQNNNGNAGGSQEQTPADGAADVARVYKPFLFIVSPLDAALDCSIATDQTNYEIKFSTPFKVYDEMEVMRMQPYVLRFEKQKMTPDEREKALSYLPEGLRKGYDYIKAQLAIRRREEEDEISRRLRMEMRRKELDAQKAAALKLQQQLQAQQQARAVSSAPTGLASHLLQAASRPSTASAVASSSVSAAANHSAAAATASHTASSNKRQALGGNGVLATIAAARASSANQALAAGRRKALPLVTASTTVMTVGALTVTTAAASPSASTPAKHPLVKGGPGGAHRFSASVTRSPLPMLPTTTTARTRPAVTTASTTAVSGATPRPTAVVAVSKQQPLPQQVRFPGGAVAIASNGARVAGINVPGSAGTSMLSSAGTADANNNTSIKAAVVTGTSGGSVITMANSGKSLPLIPTKLTRDQLEKLQRENKIIPIALVHQKSAAQTSGAATSAATGNTGLSASQHANVTAARTYALLTTANAVASTTSAPTTVSNKLILPTASSTVAGRSTPPPQAAFPSSGVFAPRNKRLLPPSATSGDAVKLLNTGTLSTAVAQPVHQRLLTTSSVVGAPATRHLLQQTVSVAAPSQNGAAKPSATVSFVKLPRRQQPQQ